MSKPVQFQVDFNTIVDGFVTARRRRATGSTENVRVGSWVQAFDLDGNTCFAEVTVINDEKLRLRLALETFGCQSEVVEMTPAPAVTFAGSARVLVEV